MSGAVVTCLLGLGSNAGDREATLRTALREINSLPDVHLVQSSQLHRTLPIGGPPRQGEFLNAAAVIETTVPPLALLDELQDVESRHGRVRTERWAPRPLDIDVLLYGNDVSETDMLTLPHPRMSFRRFVLLPAAEIAPKMMHPVIGWPVERLLLHLNSASDQAAVLSPSEAVRQQAAALLAERFGARPMERPAFATAELLWPSAVTTWLSLPSSPGKSKAMSTKRRDLPYAAAAFPKLTVLLDAPASASGIMQSQWSAIARQPGRGPTLRLQSPNNASIEAEVAAAIESVWPDLCPPDANRLESQ